MLHLSLSVSLTVVQLKRILTSRLSIINNLDPPLAAPPRDRLHFHIHSNSSDPFRQGVVTHATATSDGSWSIVDRYSVILFDILS
jgi:hypothetical protein